MSSRNWRQSCLNVLTDTLNQKRGTLDKTPITRRTESCHYDSPGAVSDNNSTERARLRSSTGLSIAYIFL